MAMSDVSLSEAVAELLSQTPPPRGSSAGHDVASLPDKSELERIAAGLSAELTCVLAKILREAQRCSVEAARQFTDGIVTRMSALESDLKPLLDLPAQAAHFHEGQTARADALEARCEAMSGEISGLQGADQERRAELAEAAARAERHAQQVGELIMQLQGRVDAQEGRIGEVRLMVEELAQTVKRLGDRLDGQTEQLRGIQQQQTRRAGILTEVLENIARLSERAAAEPEAGSLAG